MDQDIDMEAPHISALREEDSPPPNPRPQPQATSKFKVKLVMNEPRARHSGEKPLADDDEEDDIDELVDELDEDGAPSMSGAAAHGPAPPFTTTPLKGRKDKIPKAKAEKSRKRKAEKDPLQPTMATFESTFPVSPADPPGTIIEVDPSAPIQHRKKHTSTPRKAAGTGPPRARKTLSKASSNAQLSVDDHGHLSDGGYSGTAASSPPPEFRDRDLETIDASLINPDVPFQTSSSAPVPVYPLPNKPFPVQPPVKIGTGFAPILPLDKSGKRVRRWRQANREVRGIAGGRWFARCWVGDRDSAFAEHLGGPSKTPQAFVDANATALSAVSLPKLASISMSAASPGAAGTGRGSRSKGSSRSGSVPAEPHSSVVRAPTKMRTSIIASTDPADEA
ncbi:hypothetical protein PUNSTDRAFT_140677 [Punctularia strigosozonata HHB-11173 SS5]|uniref:uncharacterized protein n=1 Tax=Punctularia strigosozonata (strain HHB-11173) TaxID=741275 RepID=UPI0004418534|nr:uncharacterized protein PUNSTDRAFT_140677 [Punctularia strigosozonata HHB-11173 SS5]EIN14373.1 hypothetical protein PUNSTDRAFT_140677 [Punctularia strigosozonata HHB-11173 SS5]